MSSSDKNLSEFNDQAIPAAGDLRFGIVVSEWNHEITNALRQGAVAFLKEQGVTEENILTRTVPGSYELPLGAKFLITHGRVDAVICLGCVIQGETRHFDFICDAVANGIMELGLQENLPVIFGVLTTDHQQQARERAGGRHGNKGTEAAFTALKMAALKRELKNLP